VVWRHLKGCKILWSACLFGCLSAGLSVQSHDLKTTQLNFTEFLCMLLLAMAWSSFDGVAICYVLPVLWMTSCFHIMALWMTRHAFSKAATEHDKHNRRDFNQILLNDTYHKYLLWVALWDEVLFCNVLTSTEWLTVDNVGLIYGVCVC